MAVQFAPRLPFARAKLSVAAGGPDVLAAQLTVTLVTFAEPTVPDAFAAVHAWPDGLDATVTL